MAQLSFSLNAADGWEEAYKQLKGKKLAILEHKSVQDEAACSHCPKYQQLTSQVNKILDAVKNEAEYADLPVQVNHLKFQYYMVKSKNAEGEINCHRYMDVTPDLKPTRLDGEMRLIADQVYRFEGITTLQILDPAKEEIIYYYRGTGAESNILVQAVLTKEGSFIRTFRYEDTEEANPHRLPDLHNKSFYEQKEKSVTEELMDMAADVPDAKDETGQGNTQLGLKVKPKLKGLKIAEGNLEHTFADSGLKVKAKSELSAKGNEARILLGSEAGREIVEVQLKTKLNGETEHKLLLPYSVELPSLGALNIKGLFTEETKGQSATLAVTDRYSEWFRGEIKRNKELNITTYSVTKDFMKDEAGSVRVSFGKNEQKSRYISIGHTKTLKDNVTMVMDIKLDENRKATFFYQMKKIF